MGLLGQGERGLRLGRDLSLTGRNDGKKPGFFRETRFLPRLRRQIGLIMRPRNILHSLLLAGLLSAMTVSPALAFPPLPSSFYGRVQINGGKVPDGTVVQALIEGQVYAEGYTQTYAGDSVYGLDVPGDDPGTSAREGGQDGDVVEFEIGGVLADQSSTWQGSTNVQLDLTTVSDGPLPEPPATPTPMQSQTPVPGRQPAPTAEPPGQPAPTSLPAGQPAPPTIAPGQPTSESGEPGQAALPTVGLEQPVPAPAEPGEAIGQDDPAPTEGQPSGPLTSEPAASVPESQVDEGGGTSGNLLRIAAVVLGCLIVAGAAWAILRRR